MGNEESTDGARVCALLEDELDYQNSDSIDVVYVPPETDEVTDEENIDENIIGEEIMEADIAGTYEIQVNKDSDDPDDDIPLSEIAERAEANVAGTSRVQLNEDKGLQVAHADDSDVGDIYIEPPESAELTDEDSADEDGGGLVDNLSANQLRAAAKISIHQQDNTDDNEIISEALEEPKEEPQPVNSVEKNYYSNISWINGDVVCNEKHFFSYTTRLSSSTEANTTKATQGRICNSSG
ncbi:hypothetical protein JTB14_001907 [Gonioctena quinquepunctata]|nr:hypothetical protein JTB14_001907 [Gonioctena quinquepunctata]